jgi:hypothetical protein
LGQKENENDKGISQVVLAEALDAVDWACNMAFQGSM